MPGFLHNKHSAIHGMIQANPLLVNDEFLANCEAYTEMLINVSAKELGISFRRPKVKKAV